MKLNKLPKTTHKKKKKVGRGYGSGKAKTAGRGTKGQKARSKIRLGFEGGQLPFIRRLPYKKGFKPLRKRSPLIINVQAFNVLSDETEITEDKLIKFGWLPMEWKKGVKILGNGELKKKIIVKGLACSKGAAIKIKDAGGRVED